MARPEGYLLSEDLLNQMRRDSSKLRHTPTDALRKYIGEDNGDRYLVRITGKYTGTNFTAVDSAAYSAVQVIQDATGNFQDISGGYVWGDDSDPNSFPPIVDIASLESRNGNVSDTILQRMPNDTYVEVYQRGNQGFQTVWYADGREPHIKISFGLDYVTESGVEKLRVQPGVIYADSVSQTIPEKKFPLSSDTWIYAQYSMNLVTGVITPVTTLQNQGSRPTEVEETSTTLTIRTVIAQIASGEVTQYWDGDIYAVGKGPQGPQGPQGPSGPSGPQGAKAAIVSTSEGYNALSCIEAPSVLFFEVMTLMHCGFRTEHPIDQMFIEVCEDDLRVVSSNCENPEQIGCRIENGMLVIETKNEITAYVSCLIAGTRKGFSKFRFQRCSEEQYRANMKFWNVASGK